MGTDVGVVIVWAVGVTIVGTCVGREVGDSATDTVLLDFGCDVGAIELAAG